MTAESSYTNSSSRASMCVPSCDTCVTSVTDNPYLPDDVILSNPACDGVYVNGGDSLKFQVCFELSGDSLKLSGVF